jgi:class 3 adenylate cyclase
LNQEESLSSFERTVEESSLYGLKLRVQYGRPSYYNILKGSLLRIYNKRDIHPIDASDVILYLFFSSDVYSELKKGLKALEEYIEEGDKQYLTTQLDGFNKVLESVYHQAIEAKVPLIVLEIGLKKWLKNNVDPERFSSLYKKFTFMLQFIRKNIREQSLNTKLIDSLKEAKPVNIYLSKVKIEDIAKFIEYPNFFMDVLKILSERFIIKPAIPQIVDETSDIKWRIRNTQNAIKVKVEEEMKTLIESIHKFNIERLREAISEIEKNIVVGEAKLRGFKSRLSAKDHILKESHIDIPEIFQFIDVSLPKKIDENIEEIINILNLKLQSVPEVFYTRQFLGKKIDINTVLKYFKDNYINIFIPTVVELILEDMIKVWPGSKIGKDSFDEARWIGILARKQNPKSVFFIPEVQRDLSFPEEILGSWRETVSIMVYDIRGSSIMGAKLQDARMEDEIRNKFQSQLSEAIRDNGGFLLKDTGDGGIVFFSANSGELYNDYRAFLTGGKKQFNKEELALTPSSDASHRAIKCAKEMIEYSEKFVRKNLNRYKDWFKEFEEEGIGFDGITYEKLPPEYKKIFQIGIGIASGRPDKDVFLGINVIGNPDLTGSLVRSANVYSKARHPDRSVILVDAPTMFNFLLNVEKFETGEETRAIESHSFESKTSELQEEVMRWMKGLQGSYKINDYKIALKRIDYLLDLGTSRKYGELDLLEESLKIKSGEKIFIDKTGVEKVIYEVVLEERLGSESF